MAACINKRLKKGEPATSELNDNEWQTIDNLKEKLAPPPALAIPRPDCLIDFEINACDKHAGCVLLQKQKEGKIRLVGYWSRTFLDAEESYYAVQK